MPSSIEHVERSPETAWTALALHKVSSAPTLPNTHTSYQLSVPPPSPQVELSPVVHARYLLTTPLFSLRWKLMSRQRAPAQSASRSPTRAAIARVKRSGPSQTSTVSTARTRAGRQLTARPTCTSTSALRSSAYSGRISPSQPLSRASSSSAPFSSAGSPLSSLTPVAASAAYLLRCARWRRRGRRPGRQPTARRLQPSRGAKGSQGGKRRARHHKEREVSLGTSRWHRTALPPSCKLAA